MSKIRTLFGTFAVAAALVLAVGPTAASAAPAPQQPQARPSPGPIAIAVAVGIRHVAVKAAPKVAKAVGKKAVKKQVKPKARKRIRGSAVKLYRWSRNPETRAALAVAFTRLPKTAQGCGSGLYTHWDFSPSVLKMLLACGRGIVEVVFGGKNPLTPRNG